MVVHFRFYIEQENFSVSHDSFIISGTLFKFMFHQFCKNLTSQSIAILIHNVLLEIVQYRLILIILFVHFFQVLHLI